MSTLRYRLVLSAVVTALIAAPLPGSAAGSTNKIGTGLDARNDVHFRNNDGLSPASRRTVDLRRMVISRTTRGVEFQLRLREVAKNQSFDQYFFIYLVPQGDTPGIGYLKVRASTLRGEGGYDLQSDYASCDVAARVSRGRSSLTMRLPWRCVPSLSVKVQALAYTTPLGKQGGDKLYSKDRMRLPETVDLRR